MAAPQSLSDLLITKPVADYIARLAQQPLPACWATIGVYDGVHRGHQAILQRLITGAHAAGLPAVVITFHPHPAVVLGKQKDFKLLTTPQERVQLLAAAGADYPLVLPFSPQLAATPARDFMQALKDHLGLRHLIIGHDFALGRNREGDAAHLRELGKQLGYTLTRVDAVRADGQVFSSTAIRSALRRGAVDEAAAMLGRSYTLCGQVVHGDGRGRTINIPTANIQPPEEKLIPASGVYAGRVHVGEQTFPAVTNIGLRPTFGRTTLPRIEAHLLDFKGDLYGQQICFECLARLRDEQKFTSVDALIAQIQDDIFQTRQMLS